MRIPVCLLLLLIGTVFSFAEENVGTTLGFSVNPPAEGPHVAVDGGYMVPYTASIPGTDIAFEMIPVPGGTFQFGSPDTEADRNSDEGPQIPVMVDPMWVAKTEITWQQYQEFMGLHYVFQGFSSSGKRKVDDSNRVDAVTAPTPLYEPTFTYEYGQEPEQPATTMSQYAAQQYTKWLSGISGVQYRLPTEAEWEYAARAGSKTAYSWGDSADDIDDYVWYFDNAERPEHVGTKKPNAFGLHDMLGSVAEWTVNQYDEEGYQVFAKQKQPINATKVVVWPKVESPCVVRGGSWESDAEQVRCASRLASELDWKDADPNEPKSVWWLTDDPSRGVGFRLFRSYKPLPKEEIAKFWEASAEEILDVIEFKLMDGRAYLGLVDPELPEAIKGKK